MKKILYIHGLGSSSSGTTSTVLKECLEGRYELFAPSFRNDIETFEHLNENIVQAEKIIRKENIDLLVGSSMGGFTALHIHGVKKLIINPCMRPGEQFDGKLLSIPQSELIKYKALEQEQPDELDKHFTFALFAEDDELFSYRGLFQELYGKGKDRTIKGSHVNNRQRVIDEIVPEIDRLSALWE